LDPLDWKVCPLWELPGEQPAHKSRVGVHLVGVHFTGGHENPVEA
jgi:hypothetical protein